MIIIIVAFSDAKAKAANDRSAEKRKGSPRRIEDIMAKGSGMRALRYVETKCACQMLCNLYGICVIYEMI